MSAHPHSGKVYYVACGSYVKIGYTSQHIAHRLVSLKTRGKLLMPDDIDLEQPLQVLRLIPGCIMRDEHRIQVLFAGHHAVGEWFRLTPAFLAHLEALDYQTDRQILAGFRHSRRELKRARLQQFARQDAA